MGSEKEEMDRDSFAARSSQDDALHCVLGHSKDREDQI